MSDRPTRVLLADGHAMFAQALAEMLKDSGADGRGVEIAGFADGEGVARAAESTRPDVVVTEVDGNAGEAGRTVRRLLGVPSRPAVVVLTRHGDPRVLRAVIEAGASACVHKGSRFEDLLEAVGFAARSSEHAGYEKLDRLPIDVPFIAMPEVVVRGVLGDESADGDGRCPLSPRQLEVLLLAARGASNAQIGRSLSLSEGTVKRHLSNIYEKMGVHSRTEATAEALSKGWISERDLTGDR